MPLCVVVQELCHRRMGAVALILHRLALVYEHDGWEPRSPHILAEGTTNLTALDLEHDGVVGFVAVGVGHELKMLLRSAAVSTPLLLGMGVGVV